MGAIRANDVIMVKGSHSMGMIEIVEAIKSMEL